MAALLRNGTMGTIMSGSTSTNNYGFPSGSFTHQKQPIMPSDQKAKLLAMHRDGKANAGIYVAVVLLVYFVLVTLLLCRYGPKRRSRPISEPTTVDSSMEQGRFRFLNFQLRKFPLCCGIGCCKCLSRVCCRRRCSSQTDNITAKTMTHNIECEKEVGSGTRSSALKLNGSSIAIATKDNEIGGESNANDLERQQQQQHSSSNCLPISDGKEHRFGMIMSTDTTTTATYAVDCQHENQNDSEENGESTEED